ncbi:alcohol dehydrogenase [Paramyrothecium foliicola]|nr:alcohol dehydrogenase [Paramyrothecium foliicola]
MADVPTEQWAQVVEKLGGPAVYKKIPVQHPGPDEVLVNVKYSGVCHTDLHAMLGEFPIPMCTPLVGGHEGVGVVVAKGDLVSNIEIGDHAGIKFMNGTCMSCSYCRQATEQLCSLPRYTGYMIDGTFQQYALVKAMDAVSIPKECDMAAIAPVMCAGITAYTGLKETGIRAGDYIAIVGAGGGLGSFAVQYAKALGFRVIAIDGGEEKGTVCKDLGAEVYIDFTTTDDMVETVQKATNDGLGPHAALLLAVSEGPFQQASTYVRKKGAVVCVGLPTNGFLKASIHNVVSRMITIKGSFVGNRQDAVEAVDFFRRGLVKAPYKVVGLSQLSEVYSLMEQGKIAGRYVVDTEK